MVADAGRQQQGLFPHSQHEPPNGAQTPVPSQQVSPEPQHVSPQHASPIMQLVSPQQVPMNWPQKDSPDVPVQHGASEQHAPSPSPQHSRG